jgi:hypothetical protein
MSEEQETPAGRDWPGAHVLSLDLRSLALLRIIYGALLFLDTLVRWSDVVPFYSEYGALPRRYLLEYGANEHWFSLHMMSGSLAWTNFLFLVQALATLALMVGWHTRWATLITWLLLISLHGRNPMVLNGGDIYLRCIMFWMLFLPTGHRWSLDVKQGRGDHYSWMASIKDNCVFGMSALVVLLQIGFVYWFAALPKTDPAWTSTYTASQIALTLDQFITPVGLFFRDALTAEQLAWMTFLVIFWEFWGPFFLFFPFDRGQVRIIGILGFTALHAGFGSMMELGFFAWTGALTVFVLLPSWFWDSPLKRVSSWVDNKFGVGEPLQGDSRYRLYRETLLGFLIVYCFVWNATNEEIRPNWIRTPSRLAWIGHTLRLDQRWNMFSPGPLTEDGWYVIEGRFADGRVLDLFSGKELTWDKPKDVANTYPNQRWRKYMMNLWLAENSKYRLPYGQYLCRKWNPKGRGPEELTGFDLIYMLEVTNPDGTEQVPEKKVVWNHWCFENPEQQKEQEKKLREAIGETKLPEIKVIDKR